MYKLLLLCLTLIAIVVTPGVSQAKRSQTSMGIIALASTKDGISSIYVVRPNGTGLRRVVVDGLSPSFTPGGSILFVREGDIYSVHTSGKGLVRWTHHNAGVRVHNPVMSEDRSLILFNATLYAGSESVVRMFDMSSHGEKTLAEGFDPSLTPDQVVISFAHNNAIYSISRSRMSEHPFTPQLMWQARNAGMVRYPVYGPGSFAGLVYSQKGLDSIDGWTIRAVLYGRGDQPKEAVLARDADQPAFSPNGRFIAFIRRGDLYLMRADGSGQRLLAKGPGELSHPAWQIGGF